MIPCYTAARRLSTTLISNCNCNSTSIGIRIRIASPAAYPLYSRGPYKLRSLSNRSFAAARRNMAEIASTHSPSVHILLLGVHMNEGEPFSEEQLISMIEGDVAKGAESGLTIEYQLTRSNEPDYQLVVKRLRERAWDAVAVGAGVRFPRERSALFEGLVNTVVRNVKPLPLLLFNSTPHGVVEAYYRAREELLKAEK